MLQRLCDRLEARWPWLADWVGGRLDLQLPALGISVLTHLVLLGLIGTFTYAVGTNMHREFSTEVLNTTPLTDFATLEPTEIAEIDQTVLEPSPGSFAPEVRALMKDAAPGGLAELQPTDGGEGPRMARPEIALASHLSLPSATRLDQAVSIRGSGAEHVGDTEGAVDRVAIEVLRKLEKGRTLVVWMFDASGSLLAERKRLSKYIAAVYEHIDSHDTGELAENEGLLTAVVGFGKERDELVEPTADVAAITRAIESVALDESGVETTFQSVADVARRYGRFRRGDVPYQVMTVVVTDEVGDDEDKLELAISAARAVKMPVYVLGSPALFGRVEGYMDYTDPKTGQRFQGLPVRAGPESLAPEVVRLPFWYSGPQLEFLDAGFGPWALSRLARQTGGIYFITRMGASRLTFDPAGMREYAPDWDTRDQFQARVAKSPLRQAVIKAASITQQNLPGMPSLTFPSAETPEFKEAMARNQEIVARTLYTVEEALTTASAAAKLRDREPARRWRAHFDLVHGRLLAVRLRCYEYNWICARMKKDMPKFQNPRSNAWRLVPSGEMQSSPKAVEAAKDARRLLERVVADHPGTPWALLAQRELKDPFGFKWVETYVPPPPPEREADPAPAKKAANRPATPPPAPPRL